MGICPRACLANRQILSRFSASDMVQPYGGLKAKTPLALQADRSHEFRCSRLPRCSFSPAVRVA